MPTTTDVTGHGEVPDDTATTPPPRSCGLNWVMVALIGVSLVVAWIPTADRSHRGGFSRRGGGGSTPEADDDATTNNTAQTYVTTEAPIRPKPSTLDVTASQVPLSMTCNESTPCVYYANNGTACEYAVNLTSNATDPQLSDDFLDRCGGPVTGRAAVLSGRAGDPGLECTAWTRHVVAWTFARREGFTHINHAWRGRLRRAGVPLHEIFSDYGCFTANRAPLDSAFYHAGNSEEDSVFGFAANGTALIDMSYPFAAHQGHMVRLQKLQAQGPAYIALGALRKHKRFPRIRVAGDVLVVPLRHTTVVPGVRFAEVLAHLGRAFTSGLFDKANLTIIMQKPSDPLDEELRTWIEPWLTPHRVLWLEPFVVADVERGWYVPVMSVDPMNACSPYFTSYWLLPRMLRAVRGDANFTWGDARLRGDPSVSDEAWAKTLPRMLVVMKQAKNSRTPTKSFVVPPETRAMLEGMGYVWVTDDAPFHHRIVLISHAEQILTTYGSMMTINTYMWGGLGRPKPPPRLICLMHPKYGIERHWAVVRPARYGKQVGLTVLVSPLNAFQIPGSWTKLVGFDTAVISPAVFKPEHATFRDEDCTLDSEVATDFTSRRVEHDPNAHPQNYYSRMNATWKALPKFGLTCPQYPLLDW